MISIYFTYDVFYVTLLYLLPKWFIFQIKRANKGLNQPKIPFLFIFHHKIPKYHFIVPSNSNLITSSFLYFLC